eukprot:GHVR01168222.1.p1 GENE.GHVR01168222.1~~GHVR01168222.1.p1  ORF type:complete len:103 (+),score=17.83 GHVR01168222.1:601-909(+)
MSNSRATSALSYVSATNSKMQSEQLKEEQKDDFEDDMSFPNNFEDLIGKKEVVIDEEKKGTMDRERQSTILKYLLISLKSAFNENERKVWGIILSLIEYSPS